MQEARGNKLDNNGPIPRTRTQQDTQKRRPTTAAAPKQASQKIDTKNNRTTTEDKQPTSENTQKQTATQIENDRAWNCTERSPSNYNQSTEQTDKAAMTAPSPSLKRPRAMIGTTNIPPTQAQQPKITPTQSKYNNSLHSRMWPDPSIKNHPAYDTLLQYATAGCPVDCGPPWTHEHLVAAVNRGPHLSAKTPDAAKYLQAEAKEKERQGQARIIKWDDIKNNPHKNLKYLHLLWCHTKAEPTEQF